MEFTYENKVDRKVLFDDLVKSITDKRLMPEDEYEVAAIIESMGWNDVRAQDSFGAYDIFELASEIYHSIQQNINVSPFKAKQKLAFFSFSIDLIRNFLRGLIFALPMAISIFSMLYLRFSLWSYENFSLEIATAISIGTILSFLVVGGFTQSIARRGYLYLSMGYYDMGRKITFKFVRLGFYLSIIISLVLFILNSFLEIYPMRMFSILIAFFLFLTAIWLAVTVLYVLRKELAFTGLLIFGILLIFILSSLFGFEKIIYYQIISLLVVTVLGSLMVLYFFKSAESKMEKGISPNLPKMSLTFYSVMPNFIYGFLYFSFLFADRIISWSTNETGYMPYIIWFRGPYELGLDFALLMLMVPMGVIEVIVNKLMNNLESSQKNFRADETKTMNNLYTRTYHTYLLIFSIVTLVSSVVIYFVAQLIDNNVILNIGRGFLNNPITMMVFIVGLISYSIVSVALLNSVVLFSFSQPNLVNKSILPALIVNIVVGFLLSRWLSAVFDPQNGLHLTIFGVSDGYAFAIFGLLAGSIVFLVLSTKQVLKVFNNLDYYIYSSS